MRAPPALKGNLRTRRSTLILLPALFLTAFLWTAEAWGRR